MTKEISQLIVGAEKFHQKYFSENGNNLFATLKNGQKPKFLVVCCSDSRVDPALLFDCKPGDLFIVRNVANLIPSYESSNDSAGVAAALQFGILHLGIRNIVILGHSACGGITSLFDKEDEKKDKEFIGKWMENAIPARQKALKLPEMEKSQRVDCCAKLSLENSYKNLLTFPWLKGLIENGELLVHRLFFDIKKGVVENCTKK